MIESAGDAFVAMDAGGLIVEWNPAAERLFGWSRTEALGRRVSDTIVPCRHRAAHDQGLARYFDTGEAPVFGTRVELEVARHFDAPFLRAVAAHANGAVLLAEGRVGPALEALREAWSAWEQIDAPYEAARTRVLVGVACAQLDDKDSGSMEWDAARVVFRQVGAMPDLAALDSAARPGRSATHGLTPRELEVLRLVASGGTNKAIAETLFLSERTVDRHVSNLFTKLGVSSRAGATAFAYERGLV